MDVTMSEDKEEELVKAVKVLAGTALIPLRVAADVVGGLAESLEDYLPGPSKLASDLIDVRISALKAINKVVEKEIELLEKYKEELEVAKEEKKKEKVKVE
jgi:hypothetical protein